MAGLPGLGNVATAAICQGAAARPVACIFHMSGHRWREASRGHVACKSGGMPSMPPLRWRFIVARERRT
eukprot:3845055-Lingulodinium_polyedra.AAC.1